MLKKTSFLIVSIIFSIFVAFNLYIHWMEHIGETISFVCILISQFFVIKVLLSDVLKKGEFHV